MNWETIINRLAEHYDGFCYASYRLDNQPNRIEAATTHVLIPNYAMSLTHLSHYSDGWVHRIDFAHDFIIKAAFSDVGIVSEYPELIDWTTRYLEHLPKVELMLHRQEVSSTPSIIEYGGVRFFGIRFKHSWTSKV